MLTVPALHGAHLHMRQVDPGLLELGQRGLVARVLLERQVGPAAERGGDAREVLLEARGSGRASGWR